MQRSSAVSALTCDPSEHCVYRWVYVEQGLHEQTFWKRQDIHYTGMFMTVARSTDHAKRVGSLAWIQWRHGDHGLDVFERAYVAGVVYDLLTVS